MVNPSSQINKHFFPLAAASPQLQDPLLRLSRSAVEQEPSSPLAKLAAMKSELEIDLNMMAYIKQSV